MRNTAPLGSLRLASEYLAAATSVLPPPTTDLEAFRLKISFPAYFLVGHSIELSLKAFLLGRGATKDELRSRKFGHKLDALLSEARRRRLGSEVKLPQDETRAIVELNNCYSVKELEYAEVGYRRMPSYALVHRVAGRLCHGLQAYVRRVGA